MKLEELKRKVAQQKGWAVVDDKGKVLAAYATRAQAREYNPDARIVRVEYRVPGQRA